MELPSYKVPALRTVVYRMVGAGLGVSGPRRHGDLRGNDRRLGGRPIIRAAMRGWRPTSPLSELRCTDAGGTRRIRFDPENLAQLERQPAPALQLSGPRRPVDRAGRSAAGLGLANRLRGDCLVSGPRSRDGRAGCDLPTWAPTSTSARRKTRADLRDQLRAARWDDTGEPVYNLAVALSIMVFFALCAQCAATLAVIRRETNSWRWPAFTFAYMTALAYVGALVTYQVTIRLIYASCIHFAAGLAPRVQSHARRPCHLDRRSRRGFSRAPRMAPLSAPRRRALRFMREAARPRPATPQPLVSISPLVVARTGAETQGRDDRTLSCVPWRLRAFA